MAMVMASDEYAEMAQRPAARRREPRREPTSDDRNTRLDLLGSWALTLVDRTVTLPSSAQRLTVLVALHGCQRRSYLAGILWPDVRDKQALTRLRCTLCRVRQECQELLETDGQTVSLATSVRVDVADLEIMARDVIEARVAPEDLDEVCDRLIAPPELLLGWYDDWVLQERDRLSQLRVRALEALVDQLIAVGRHNAAYEAASAAIRLDPLRESTHRALMRVHLAEGNPALARRQVRQYREILREELGMEEPTRAMLEMVNWSDSGEEDGRAELLLRGA